MKKRLQVVLNDETWAAVDALMKEANDNFQVGSISYSDAINEMILCSKVDVKALQRKHTDWRRSLRFLASKSDADLETALNSLKELKSQTTKKQKSGNSMEAM